MIKGSLIRSISLDISNRWLRESINLKFSKIVFNSDILDSSKINFSISDKFHFVSSSNCSNHFLS